MTRTAETRLGTRIKLATGAAMLQLLARTGDPVAQFLALRPGDDLYAIHERIRAAGPFTRSRTGMVGLTTWALCDAVLRDRRFGVRTAEGPAGYGPLDVQAQGPLRDSFLELDPPDHTRLRRIVAPAFRPKLIRGYADRIEAIAHHLVDRLEQREHVDLMADFAAPFPITVIRELLGIPDTDDARFAAYGQLIGQSLDGVRSIRHADALATASAELGEMCTQLAHTRRTNPRDDVISLLAAAQDEGSMSAGDLVATCGLLLIAGFETTVNLIGNGIAAVLAERQHWQSLLDDPSVASQLVEETLRYDPPVQATMRIAHEDLELAGHSVPKGTLVLIDLAAANRDPAVYPEPARFQPDRFGAPEHLAFSSGIHYCLGAPLARLEGEIALQVLAQRLPQLRSAGPARRRPGSTIRGFATFPVDLGSRHRATLG